MKALIKSVTLIGMMGGLFTLLAVMSTQSGTAFAAMHNSLSGPAATTLKLQGAAGMQIHANSGVTAPVIYTNGHAVTVTLQGGTTYVVTHQSDIQGYWLDVTVPKSINLDIQGQSPSIQVDGVDGQMVIATVDSGNVGITNSKLEGISKISGKSTNLSFSGQLDSQSDSTFAIDGDGPIQVTLPSNTKLHLKADVHNNGNLTGNFPGLPNNPPLPFDGFLNSNPGDSVALLTLDIHHNGSIGLNHQ